MISEYKIIVASSHSSLDEKVSSLIKEGWKVNGGHQAVEKHHQNRFAGTQHRDTVIEVEYSQSLIKE